MYARRVIKQFMKIQDRLLSKLPEELREEIAREEGSVAVLHLYDELDENANEMLYLKLENGRIKEIPPADYRHKISMDIDTFLDLLFENGSFAAYWASGRIQFEGVDYALHAIKWAKWFETVRKLLRKYVLKR